MIDICIKILYNIYYIYRINEYVKRWIIMGKVKEKEIQLIYDAICESADIQKLIKRIANASNTSDSINSSNDSSREVEILRSQLSNTQLQLKQATDKLEQYKEFYSQAKPKLEKYTNLEGEVDDLRKKERKYISEIEKSKSEIKRIEDVINALNSENESLSSELKSTTKTIQELKKQFETPVKYLELYRSLSYSVRSGLENVIIDTNEITFIASCSNDSNLSSIWEYMKEISDETESKDFKALNLIFDYFFDVFNDSLPEPKYKRDDVEIGDDLDDDYYDRAYGSSTSGEITKIILRGYKSRNTGKIIHKSLVKA